MREFRDLCVDGGVYERIGFVMRDCGRLWAFGDVYEFVGEFMRV